MTLKQIRFKHRVENSLKGYIAISTGKCSGCKSCNKEENEPEIEVDETGEPYFSWHPCVLCHSRLGGGREDVHAVDEKTNEIVHLGGCCVDCVAYIANGELPRCGYIQESE